MDRLNNRQTQNELIKEKTTDKMLDGTTEQTIATVE